MRAFTKGMARGGFASALVILAVVGGLSYQSNRSLVGAESAIFRSQTILNGLGDLLLETLDAENAERGFLVSGIDSAVRARYIPNNIDTQLGHLEILLRAEPRQKQDLALLKTLISEKLAFHQYLIDLRQNSGPEAARQLFLTGRGHVLMDEIRRRVGVMEAAEERILREQTSAARFRSEFSAVALIVGSVVSCGILLWVYRHLNQEILRRRASEEKVRHLNRVHMLLSHVNQSIVHIRDRDELFRTVCRMAVENSFFRMAWVGVVRPDSGTVEPVAWAGFEDGYLSRIRITTDDTAEGHGPTGQALRDRHHFVCSEIATDSRFLPWRNDALARGYKSAAAFPIQFGDTVAGVITVYAAEPGFFNDEVVTLLGEVTADLSFALESMDREERNRLAEHALRMQDEILRRSEEKYRRIVETASEGIWIVDRNNITTFINEELVGMLGYSVEEMVGKSLLDFIPDADSRALASRTLTRLKDGRKENLDFRFRLKNGDDVWTFVRTTPVFEDGHYAGAMAMLTDITERKKAEQEVLRLNQDLEKRVAERTAELERMTGELESRNREVERANRMKTDFLARMSHELRTPLNAIVGYSDLLAEEGGGPLSPTYRRFTANIQEGARHLLEMVNDVLDLSKIEAGRIDLNREVFYATGALDEVLSVIMPLAQIKKIAIENQLPANLAINADRTRFKQILYNLLSNAVKFTPEGGRVWVTDASREDAAGICVGDTGIGLPSEELSAIFDEFHQAGTPPGTPHEGTGLGLAITRRLAELHGGETWAESTVGQGSRFFFSLGSGSLQPGAAAQAEA